MAGILDLGSGPVILKELGWYVSTTMDEGAGPSGPLPQG